jgi:hypothetical protein
MMFAVLYRQLQGMLNGDWCLAMDNGYWLLVRNCVSVLPLRLQSAIDFESRACRVVFAPNFFDWNAIFTFLGHGKIPSACAEGHPCSSNRNVHTTQQYGVRVERASVKSQNTFFVVPPSPNEKRERA